MADNKATLQDMLNYQPDLYFSADEISLIQNTFSNPKIVKVLRKALIPSVGDLELPIEEMGNDVWLQGVDYSQMQEKEVKPYVLGRQMALKFIMGGLIKLKVIANAKPENEIEASYRRSKDSVK